MGVINVNKELSVSQIECGGSFNIKLSLTAEPSIIKSPTDIVLILDRSGSMSGSHLANLKNGAKKFIDIISEATDGAQDGKIGSGSRIAVVSFAATATQDTQLITSVADLKDAVDSLTAGGSTNHADGFTKALELFSPTSSNAKVMIMFTDGKTTAGSDPDIVASAAKAQGVTIYGIGLSGNGGIDEAALKKWASEPSSAYVVITPNDAELEALFEDLAKNIAKPGATDVVITDTVAPCFQIISLTSPSTGCASMVGTNTVEWKIDELGASKSEGAVLVFKVQHIGPCAGAVEVNESISYTDAEQNKVEFPSPVINVECGVDVYPEDCPQPVYIEIGGCSDTEEFDACELGMESLGRILQLDVTLRDVCPNKRIALAVLLYEVDSCGKLHKRGLKTMTIPAVSATTGSSCRDVTVRCIKFVLPEDLNVSGCKDCLCGCRKFKAQFIANYIDSDFECCTS